MGHRMSELRIILFIAAVLALAAFMARHWTANATVMGDQPRLVTQAGAQPASIPQARLRTITGASLRVAASF